ncbi:MAG: Xaa-Pro peptidase family protein [candidate division KSB1 bacterium]|nr:Xaa-Pro peptidase family protein [candidate division KSB1 bacterium]MDZ7310570.1 Xaa-Pro peptidase family protein [candidate division KSB1 bacterium]
MLIKEKVAQAVQILQEYHVDCWITFARETQINGDPTLPFLVAGDLTWHSAIIISSSGKKHAIVGRYDKKSVEDLGVYDEVVDFVEGIRPLFVPYMKKLNPARIAINYSQDSEICDGLTHGMYLTLYDMLSEIGFQDRLISAEPVISALRQRKSPTEIKYITEAIRQAENILALTAKFIKPGRTEAEIAAFMKKKVEEAGLKLAWDPKVCPAVFTGPETAHAHYNPTLRTVQEGHVLNIDFGVKYEGYCSDLQRTFYILAQGETRAPEEVQRGFDTIVQAIEESRKALKPGARGHEIDAIARKIVTSQGYKEFPHGVGHQVGRFSHDGTALLGPAWEKYAKKPFVPIEENMVFTIEPRLTVPNRGTVTVEEMFVVKNSGAEFLSKPQKELILIHS